MSEKKISEDEEVKKINSLSQLPILPLRNSVFFPGAVMPITVGRTKTIKLVEETINKRGIIGIVTQKMPDLDDPKIEDIFLTGTIARIIKVTQTGKEGFNIVVEGIKRFKILKFTQDDPYILASIQQLSDHMSEDVEVEALFLNLKGMAREVIDLLPEIPLMAKQLVDSIGSPGHLADMIAANIDVTVLEKHEILKTIDIKDRLSMVLKLLNKQREVLKLSNKINTQVKGEMSRSQREYFLRQQLKAIKEELGEKDDDDGTIEEIEKKIQENKLPDEAKKAVKKELKRLKNMQPNQAEYMVTRTYLDWILDLPWNIQSKDILDLEYTKKRLHLDHYGLEKIKKRIVEFLAVRKLKNDLKGPILCFIGPPGVGKTSLGRSIADSLGRKFCRISLGGVRDEAEIRGHRRTYIGALPGRIIQGIKKCGTNNPVFLLDEIDKIGNDFRGDPSSALLEVLDPEQNHSFSDHYIEINFDLSNVLFVATGNQMGTMPIALRDRMEIIDIPGYTFIEKLKIAKYHLIPKQIIKHGIINNQIKFTEGSILKIATDYTREAGVRNLEREIASVCRNVAVQIVETNEKKQQFRSITIKKNYLKHFIGPEKFYNESIERTSTPGVAIGLAWTSVGGELLYIEVTKMEGKGNIILTGQLGSVMKESAQIAFSWVRSKASEIGIDKDLYKKNFKDIDIHIHFPSGAIPKDGPSAGITITSAIVSLLTGKCVRNDTAMTGEITLRGLVLPVGGIKEKVLAAHRLGVSRIILPLRNKPDLIDIPPYIIKKIRFIYVRLIEDALKESIKKIIL